MIARTSRQLIAQAAILLAVCIGAWMLLVKPKVDAVAKHRQTLAEHKSATASAFNQKSVTDAASRMDAIRHRVTEIESCNRLAEDSSRLYGMIMDLADANRVQVHNLQPNNVKQPADNGRMNVTRINLSAEGEYDDVAKFLEGTCSLNAFVRPVGVDLTPSRTAGSTRVELNFSCDLVSFAVDESLASAGAAHAQP